MSNTVPQTKHTGADYVKPLIMVGVLFFIIGFFTWINGPLITFVKVAFTFTDIEAFLVPLVFYLSYLVFSLPASWVLNKTGMKSGLSYALVLMAIGAGAFGQCVADRWFPGALTGLFVIGAGLALLQTAVNPYVSILGPIESGAQRIAMMGICNKCAGILAPILFGLMLSNIQGIDDSVRNAASVAERNDILNSFAYKIYYPYMGMAVVLVLTAIWLYRSSLPEIHGDESEEGAAGKGRFPTSARLWFGVLCIFVYVGVEVLAGDAIGTYGNGFHISVDQTKYFTSLTLAAMLVGYGAGIIAIPRFVSQEVYLIFSTVLGIFFALGAYVSTGYTSVLCVALLGFANAMMWPAIFPIALRGLGEQTAMGSAFLIMGIVGGAVIPQVFVHLKEVYNFQLVFMALAVVSYLCILLYAVYGWRSLKPHQV